MTKVFFFLIVIVFSISCKTFYAVSGNYEFKNGSINAILSLDSLNKSFEYNSTGEMIHVYSSGKWWIIQDTLFVKSYESITSKNGKVIENIIGKNNYIDINTFSMSGDTLVDVPVIINERDTFFTNKSGNIKFYGMVTSLFLTPYLNYEFFYTPRNSKSNYFNIYLDPIDNTNKYFQAKRFQIKGNKLIDNGIMYVKMKK